MSIMLIGRIAKASRTFWYAECDVVGAYTQGRSRKDALAMLADCIMAKVDRRGFRVTVTEIGRSHAGGYAVIVESSKPSLLAAEVLKYQRERHRMSLADVAKKLSRSERKTYASYEQGHREPTVQKFCELLAIVAPELVVTLGPRAVGAKTV